MPDSRCAPATLTDEQIECFTGIIRECAADPKLALSDPDLVDRCLAAAVARAKREALAEAGALSGDQAVEAARYVRDLLRGEPDLPDADTLALAIEYTAGMVAVHAKREERERIAGWLAELASTYRDAGADPVAIALDRCAVDLEATDD